MTQCRSPSTRQLCSGKMLRGIDLVHALHEERREPHSLQGLPFCVAVIFLGSTPRELRVVVEEVRGSWLARTFYLGS